MGRGVMGAREVVAHANLREGDEDVAHYSATSGTGSEKNTHTHTHTHTYTHKRSAPRLMICTRTHSGSSCTRIVREDGHQAVCVLDAGLYTAARARRGQSVP